MESNNKDIKKSFGNIFQQYRLNKNLTQEKLAEILSKSTKTISQIETGTDGTSKMTDIELINYLEIEPNVLYKDFISNHNLQNKIALSQAISELPNEKIQAIIQIVDIIKKL